ncbi:MAG: C40 family peptidase [Gemmatimonadaceae bacterium]|nr:C40 family peptidase [Gemmatimonadaceae bacterium]
MSTATTVRVRAAIAPLHAEPRAASEQVSQSAAGHLATILEAGDGWHRVRLVDGYEGWMHEGYLDTSALDANEAEAWKTGALYSLGCTMIDTVTGLERALPLGARVAGSAKIVAGGALYAKELRRRYPPAGIEVCASAARWFASTSYQWGGITPWGADCSGMVQTTFGLHGAALPRDARQQAELGTALELTPDAWRPGDLLVFSDRADGRITHVAIVAPRRTLMHVAIGRGGFAVEQIDDAADPYTLALMGRLRGARRLL